MSQWTPPIPITIGYYRVYSRQKKRNIADKRLEKGGGGRLQAVGVGGFFEIGDRLDSWWSMIRHWSSNCRAGFSYDCWRFDSWKWHVVEWNSYKELISMWVWVVRDTICHWTFVLFLWISACTLWVEWLKEGRLRNTFHVRFVLK